MSNLMKVLFVVSVLLLFATNANTQTWEQTNGPYGGTVQALAINSSGDVFAGTYDGGVFRSTDNGESWAQINNGLINPDVFALAINSSGDIFAGTNGSYVYVADWQSGLQILKFVP